MGYRAKTRFQPGQIVPLPQGSARLTLRFANLRNDNGLLRVALFQSPVGFPSQHEKALHFESLPIAHGCAEICWDALPAGRYAFSYYHDETACGRLPHNVLGQPTVDYGFSSGARGLFAAPKFSEAAFVLPPGETVLHERVRRVKRFA